MLYMRNVRFTIMGVNMLLLGFVETARIEDRRLNLAIQLLGKGVCPGYFVKCVAVDASCSVLRCRCGRGCGPRTKIGTASSLCCTSFSCTRS